jgi:outer membrane protein assembly factor BamB
MGLGQQANPVYVDDSPAASDTFVRVREHVSAGNLDEAVRVLQVLLDEQPDRLVALPNDSDLFRSVRTATNDTLLTNKALLERYRTTFGPRAERLFGEGQIETVERGLLLTPAGFDAVLRLAQAAVEDARFEHARLLLEQLDRHPDRVKERARLASDSATLIARYLDRAPLRDLATRWAKDGAAGVPDLTPIQWPPAAKAQAASPMRPLGPTTVQGMVSKPLWTVPLNPSAVVPEANLGTGNGNRSAVSLPMFARDLLLLPTVSGDTVFVNDGSQIAAWDRFTLNPRWTATPGVADAPLGDTGIRGDRRRIDRFNYGGYTARSDDVCTVAVSGRTVVGATGRSGSGSHSDGDDRVLAIDTITGRFRWTAQLNTLDPPALYEATVRGPIEIFENTVVFAARKHLPDRRLVSVSMVGLDLPTGKLKWVRPVGSAGSMPWVLQAMGADGATVSRGVAFRADRLGVIGAVEVGSGRARWVRRLPVETSANSDQPLAWQLACPIADSGPDGAGGSIIFISPDMRRLIRLDQSTGAIISQRDVNDLTSAAPKYLLRCGPNGSKLACIGDDRIAFLSTSAMEIDKPEYSMPIVQPGIRGRCVVSGDKLLVPVSGGFHILDPMHPSDAPLVPLEDSGNVLPLDSQVMVLDDARLHSYLQWDVAERLLTERIKADPADPSPAVTFAELAYRAGKPDRIVSAARQAMTALRNGPQNDSTWNARARLIEAMQGMLATALEPPPPLSPGASPARPSRPGIAIAPITDRSILEQIVTLLGEVSFEPPDKLAHTLALGRLAELNEHPADAVAAYQKVLIEPALAGATWRGPQVSIRGELEAARRMETLLKRLGPDAYAAQEQAAVADLATFGPAPTQTQLETLAARYPLSQQTPSIWVKLADMAAADKKPQQAAAALEAGLRSASRQPAPPEPVVGEIAGRLIVDLREHKQLTAAAAVLRSVRARFPGLALTSAGQPLDAERLGAEIAARLAANMRWPRIGAIRTEKAQAIPGWTMLDPLLSDRMPSVTGLLPLVSEDEVGIWTVPTTDRSDKNELLAKAWSAPLPEGSHAVLIKTTPEAAFFAVMKDSDATIMKIGGTPLESKWHTPPLSKAFSGAEGRASMRSLPGVQPMLTTPGEGETSPTNFIVAMDERTMVLVQRTGRAVAYDTDTGEQLWASRVGVGRVYDIDLASGTLAVGGDQETYGPPPAATTVVDLKPVIQLLDARTGRPAQRIGDLGAHVRWIGFADGAAAGAGGAAGSGGGSLIAALDNSVVCIDLASARPNWTISTPEAMPVSAMWIFGDELVMADQSRNIWLASVSTGRMRPAALEVPRSHLDLTQTLDAFPLSPASGAGFGVSTQQGLAIFAPDGALTGVDGLNGASTMLRPRPADGRALTIETVADGRTPDGMMFFTIHALDVAGGTGASLIDSRPVPLGARPAAMTLMDDRVAITAGNTTVILHAPAK